MGRKNNKNSFSLPYIGIDNHNGIDILYHEDSHYSIVIKCNNPILIYSGDLEKYEQFHHTFDSILKNLGGGFILQKHDIFSQATYSHTEGDEYLQKKYFETFNGRSYKKVTTYITITQIAKKGIFTFNKNTFELFLKNSQKVFSILSDSGFNPVYLNKYEIDNLIKRFLAFNFSDNAFSINNFEATKQDIIFPTKTVRSIAVLDCEEGNVPTEISNSRNMNLGYLFPVDLMNFLNEMDGYDEMIYHQMIKLPVQKKEIHKLDATKRRASSMPGADNDIKVRDTIEVERRVAEENQLVVYAHFNIIIKADHDKIVELNNNVESALYSFGCIPTQNADNQLELWVGSFPGNGVNIQNYDLFWTTSDPTICFFFKERLQVTDDSDFKIYFSDRQGVPVGIDLSDMPVQTGQINNRNKFVLGPSGSGKSFLMNHVIRQYVLYNTDVVLVDTGHSYYGICNYYGGKYITYSEEKPITMNPFNISEREYNEEKREFLKSLLAVIWKGTDNVLNQVEDTAITNTIFAYYRNYFNQDSKSEKNYESINPVTELSFNSFFEFSCDYLEMLIEQEGISFDLNGYKFILQKFYRGGEYDRILNDDFDTTLFDEKFIVFEIDAIKEHKTLFPIVTLIIMDVFIQKMRLKKNRKILVIEEAWKAIASPTMAGYILYLYKTVRKFFGECIIVTQELDDILGNEIVKNSIVNNSDTIILLDQAKFRDNYKEISELLSISDVEQKKIFTINNLNNKAGRNRFKEVYISMGGVGDVYGVEVSPYEYFTYTTERQEKDALNIYIDKYQDIRLALEHFFDDLQQSGLSTSKFVKQVNQNVLQLN